jgi:hypothetical protein
MEFGAVLRDYNSRVLPGDDHEANLARSHPPHSISFEDSIAYYSGTLLTMLS